MRASTVVRKERDGIQVVRALSGDDGGGAVGYADQVDIPKESGGRNRNRNDENENENG